MTRQKFKYIFGFLVALILIVLIIENSGRLIYPLKYKEVVFDNATKNEIDPYLVFAIMKAESNFDPKATSHKKARGLMQIMDGTGKWGADSMGLESYRTEDLYKPEINIAIGCWYLNWLMKEFDGNVDLVIAAYNGGSGRVKEWLKNKEYSATGNELDRIPYKETSIYLKKVKNYYITYKELYE